MDTETHECIAVHCTVCCPQRQAYEDGWQSGENYAKGMMLMREVPMHVSVSVSLIMLVLVVAGVWYWRKYRSPST